MNDDRAAVQHLPAVRRLLIGADAVPDIASRAERLAARLQLELERLPGSGVRGRRAASDRASLDLQLDARGLALLRGDGARVAPAFADGRRAGHAREGGLAGQPFARALGIAALTARLERDVHVLDATAGLGGDTWLAAALGARVVACEREPVLHALLEDALARAGAHDDARTRALAARITLVGGDMCEVGDVPCDVAYLDPMYPERRVRGGQRKDIDALQRIAGHDRDDGTLLAAARARAGELVVVKRPRAAAPLFSADGLLPDDAVHGPNTRYDRYRSPAANRSIGVRVNRESS